MLFDTLALISLLIVIMLLKKMVNIFPSLVACLIRWKENVNLEMSVKLRRDRNIIACALVIPFCLTAYRFRLYYPSFLARLDENTGLCATIGIFIVYVILRKSATFVARPRKASPAAYRTADAASHTFFIILALVLLATGGTLAFLNINPETIKTAMIWVSGIIYLMFLLRKFQIFASSYNFFTDFLYLCALEIVPTGLMLIPVIIL